MCLIVMVVYSVNAQTQTGYKVPSGIDVGNNSRATQQENKQPSGTTSTFVTRYGTQGVTGSGSTGYMSGTDTLFPRSVWTPSTGKLNFIDIALQMAGSDIPSAGSLSAKLDAVSGVGTTNTFNSPTLAGLGTITASFGSNGLVITPAEYASVNNATGELQAQINTKQPTLGYTPPANTQGSITTALGYTPIQNSIGSITDVLGYTPPANTQGSITTAIGYTPIQNSVGSITGVLGYTPPANTQGSITTALNYTPLGNATGSVTTALNSQSVNTLSDVNISMNENDFVKIVGGVLVAGSSSATVAFPEVTGSATSAQLPLIIKLYATTTAQTAGDFGQLYVERANAQGYFATDNFALLLFCDNAGTSTFVDSSPSPKTVVALANAIGTSTTILENASYYGDGIGDGLRINDDDAFAYGTSSMTIGTTIQWIATSTTDLYRQRQDASNEALIRYSNNAFVGNTDLLFLFESGGVEKANYSMEFNPVVGTKYSFEFDRSGTDFYIFVDGVSGTLTTTTAIGTNSLPNLSAFLYLLSDEGAGNELNGYMDGYYIVKGQALHTSNYPSPTYQRPQGSLHTQYTARYDDPINGNHILSVQTPGTSTLDPSYVLINATTTVFGLGTTTAITATSTAYSGWFGGAVRATAFNVASTEKIKENIEELGIKPNWLDAEGEAKEKYVKNNRTTWILNNKNKYKNALNEPGSGTVTILDYAGMETDYNTYIELKWASDLSRNILIEDVQKQAEIAFWKSFDGIMPKSWNPKGIPGITRRGLIVEEAPDQIKGDDKESIDYAAVSVNTINATKALKIDTISMLKCQKSMLEALQRLGGTMTFGTIDDKLDEINTRLEVLNP